MSVYLHIAHCLVLMSQTKDKLDTMEHTSWLKTVRTLDLQATSHTDVKEDSEACYSQGELGEELLLTAFQARSVRLLCMEAMLYTSCLVGNQSRLLMAL